MQIGFKGKKNFTFGWPIKNKDGLSLLVQSKYPGSANIQTLRIYCSVEFFTTSQRMALELQTPKLGGEGERNDSPLLRKTFALVSNSQN